MTNQDQHITYLFGAGSSWHSMPVVAELNADLHKWASLADNIDAKDQACSNQFIDQLPSLRYKFIWQCLKPTLSEIDRFATIDTLARYYTLRQMPNELARLKKVIDGYFSLRQFTMEGLHLTSDMHRSHHKRGYDYRYDSLFAAILEVGGELPQNISFISWNYDLEVERSLGKFSDKSVADEAINVYHINGHSLLPSERFNDADIGWMQCLFSVGGEDIQYAWERLELVKQELRLRLKNTTHLVVIGYSFPVFNREIDRLILAASKLTKIYLQDKKDQLPGIENRLKALLAERANYVPAQHTIFQGGSREETRPQQGVQIELIDSVDQFHIPFELR